MSDLKQHSVKLTAAPLAAVEELGEQARFYGRAVRKMPMAVLKYPREILHVLAEVSFGSGAMVVIGGTIGVVVFLTSFAGIELGIQGYSQLSDIGVEALSGFVSAYINTRLVAPLVAGVGLVATVGAGFTARLGAMRVSEEIDALEVMSVQSVPFLVSTRIIAGLLAIVPLYTLALLASYAFTRVVVIVIYGQSSGAYTHYFETFLIPSDILASFIKVIIMAAVVMAIHCYYGYTATGGPAGVGRAVGRAVRLSLIAVALTDMLLSLVLYGNADTLNISG